MYIVERLLQSSSSTFSLLTWWPLCVCVHVASAPEISPIHRWPVSSALLPTGGSVLYMSTSTELQLCTLAPIPPFPPPSLHVVTKTFGEWWHELDIHKGSSSSIISVWCGWWKRGRRSPEKQCFAPGCAAWLWQTWNWNPWHRLQQHLIRKKLERPLMSSQRGRANTYDLCDSAMRWAITGYK